MSSAPDNRDAGAGRSRGCPSEWQNGTEEARDMASRAVSRSCDLGVMDLTTGDDGTALIHLPVSKDLLPPDAPGPEAWQSSAARHQPL